MQALTGSIIHTGTETLADHAVLIDENGVITAIVPAAKVPRDARQHDLGGGHLAPGFIDLQVNGGGGVMFNDEPTPDAVRRIAAAHRTFGVTGLLPTFISGPAGDMARAADAVATAINTVPGVLGIHFEGPHLNPEKAGVHDATQFRACDADALATLLALEDGCTLVTLAPECVATDAIEVLAAQGAVVAAGHTLAGPEELGPAVAAGLTGITHLFNAMAPLGSREPGTVGGALASDDLWCGLIADGHHVHPVSIAAAWRAKRSGKLLLVSDAMAPVGGPPTSTFTTAGQMVHVGDGRCTTAEGRLAGSMLSLDVAVRYCVEAAGIPLDEALRMASTYPAKAIGEDERRGLIAPGYEADLVALDESLAPVATWISGACERTTRNETDNAHRN